MMEFSQPQKYTARVSDKYFVSDNQRFLYIKFELVLPDRISYQAGQYVSLKISEQGERRSYSIANTPDNTHGFHLLIEMVREGKGSKYVQNLEIGEVVEVMAPLGKFVISDEKYSSIPVIQSPSKLLFVATGSGIVPIYAMINELLLNKNETRQMRLHWGMRSEEDLFFVDNLARLAETHPNFVFDIVLSRPSEEWDLCVGHVQDCLRRDFPVDGPGLGGWEGYVCGSPERVLDICLTLETLGMEKQNIYHEKFV